MEQMTRRGVGRGVVSVVAAVGLLFGLLATPASASDAPVETDIKGKLKGGELVLQGDPDDVVFPLGQKDEELTVCDPEHPNNNKTWEQRSNFEATVDANGDLDDFVFRFNQASTGIKYGGEEDDEFLVCAQIEITNAGDLVGEADGKSVQLVDSTSAGDGPAVRVIFRGKDQETASKDVWTCHLNVQTGEHAGLFAPPKDPDPELDPPKEPHDWNLTHEPKDNKFVVPEVQTSFFNPFCPGAAADPINEGLGLPTEGSASFKWAVYDCGADPEPDFCVKD